MALAAEAAIGEGIAHERREGFWAHDDVTPRAEAQSRRATDASKLTFPLPLMLFIIASVVSILGGLYVLQSGIGNLQTRMDDRKILDAKQSELDAERNHNIEHQLESNDKKYELLRLEFQQLREQMLFKGKEK